MIKVKQAGKRTQKAPIDVPGMLVRSSNPNYVWMAVRHTASEGNGLAGYVFFTDKEQPVFVRARDFNDLGVYPCQPGTSVVIEQD
jgi:hypothetical protein